MVCKYIVFKQKRYSLLYFPLHYFTILQLYKISPYIRYLRVDQQFHPVGLSENMYTILSRYNSKAIWKNCFFCEKKCIKPNLDKSCPDICTIIQTIVKFSNLMCFDCRKLIFVLVLEYTSLRNIRFLSHTNVYK